MNESLSKVIGNVAGTEDFSGVLAFALIACIVAFLLSPIFIKILYRFGVVRKNHGDATLIGADKQHKINTPTMGGLLVILVIAILTISFNWSRAYTYVPIGVMVLAASLGAVDDILNIFGGTRRRRTLKQTLVLARVHNSFLMRMWYYITLPWAAIRNLIMAFGSKQNRGVQAHEKLLLQFAAGAIAAWWIYFRLGEAWHSLTIPFIGTYVIGWWIIPIIIGTVVFTANAVNIVDGLDGLTGGMLIPTFGALSILSWLGGFQSLAILNACALGALIAYTYFNIKPARFPMGDVGSLGLGALLAINSLAIGQIISLIFLAFMFYAEAISVIIQVIGRYLFGRRIFKMAPLHHHLELSGWSEEKTIMRLWMIHLFFVILGMWLGMH